MLEQVVLTSATSSRAAQYLLSGAAEENRSSLGIRLREAEIQGKRICFQLK